MNMDTSRMIREKVMLKDNNRSSRKVGIGMTITTIMPMMPTATASSCGWADMNFSIRLAIEPQPHTKN